MPCTGIPLCGDALADELTPGMPCDAPRKQAHRSKHPDGDFYSAFVARSVKPSEVRTNLEAQSAMQKEWDRLRAVVRPDGTKGCWDEHLVQEWSCVRKDAKRRGTKANVGLVFGIVVEKNHELPEGHASRKYKGRAVFQGNNVRDENGAWAVFQELSSCPATMEAARAADAYGLMPGHACQQSDATQAYTQAWLLGDGVETWVRLPRDQWPPSWKGMQDPVCPLRLALYGHPDSGGHWERHCSEHLASVGFQGINSWRSCFWHPELRLYLVVYVDVFKLSGPSENLRKG